MGAIDVLDELEPGRRLGWEIEQLADELSAVFGRPVDLVSPALHRRLEDAVLSEARGTSHRNSRRSSELPTPR